MSLSDHADGLVKIAVGRLYKSFDEAMRMDCGAIELAYEGHLDMLESVFGGKEEPKKLTQSLFKSMFGKRGR